MTTTGSGRIKSVNSYKSEADMQKKHFGNRRGFSLIELLVVIAIIAMLAGGIVAVSKTVRTKARIRNTETTIQLLCGALEEFKQENRNNPFFEDNGFPVGIGWPPELDDLDIVNGLGKRLEDYYVDYTSVPAAKVDDPVDNEEYPDKEHGDFTWDDADDFVGTIEMIEIHQDERIGARASIEFLYCILSDFDECRVFLNKLPDSATANDDGDSIEIAGEQKPLIEVQDAWGHPILYLALGAGNFPRLISAGPDGMFDTADDVISSEL